RGAGAAARLRAAGHRTAQPRPCHRRTRGRPLHDCDRPTPRESRLADQPPEGGTEMNKGLAAIAVAVAAIAAAAGLFASTSSGAAKAQRTIGLIDPAPNSSIAPYVEAGGQAAATALGDQLAIKEAPDTATQTSAIESLIAQHVAAIAVDNEGLGPA